MLVFETSPRRNDKRMNENVHNTPFPVSGGAKHLLFGGFEWEMDFCLLISCDQDYNAINAKKACCTNTEAERWKLF